VAGIAHYRLDDLRRFASGLAAAAGVPATRASALASHLLWFDAAGAAPFGIATLPALLDRIASGEIDPGAEGVPVAERGGTAVFDGRRGVPLLVLDRVAGLATEKARETGVGVVRVENVASPGPAAVVAAEIAVVGPYVGAVLGPGPSWSLALPSDGGLPVVFDTALASPTDGKAPRRAKGAPPVNPVDAIIGPWAGVLAPGDGYLVAALGVTAMEALSTFHERVADAIRGLDETAGRLLPGPWEARRVAAQEHGVAVDPAAWKALVGWADRSSVVPPAPLSAAGARPHTA